MIVWPEDWPDDVRAGYAASYAAGDLARQADLIEMQTGEQPAPGGPEVGLIHQYRPPGVIAFRMRGDGPQ